MYHHHQRVVLMLLNISKVLMIEVLRLKLVKTLVLELRYDWTSKSSTTVVIEVVQLESLENLVSNLELKHELEKLEGDV